SSPQLPVKIEPFTPRYGHKPFYFAVDKTGRVLLNFKGHWMPTHHVLVDPTRRLSARPELATVRGQVVEVVPVEVNDLRDPRSEADDVRPWKEEALLFETSVTEQTEGKILSDFESARHVVLTGGPAGGKTSIAKEVFWLLGLKEFRLQMHGERELEHVFGSYNEDDHGRLRLDARPLPVKEQALRLISAKTKTRLAAANILMPDREHLGYFVWGSTVIGNGNLKDALKRLVSEGKEIPLSEQKILLECQHYRLPLLEFLAHGGGYTLDEGPVGEGGEDVIGWFSGIVNGDKRVSVDIFPGVSIVMDVHPDFHLVVTMNPPENTPSRRRIKSEVASAVDTIIVSDEETAPELEGVFERFWGAASLDSGTRQRFISDVAAMHLKLKGRMQPKDETTAKNDVIGKDRPEMNFISKREVRRIANWFRSKAGSLTDTKEMGYVYYTALRAVYESMFVGNKDREAVRGLIDDSIDQMFPEVDEKGNSVSKLFAQRLSGEQAAKFGRYLTEEELFVMWVVDSLLDQGESILNVFEYGSRLGEMVRALAQARGAQLDVIDSTPEQGSAEIIGGRQAVIGPVVAGERRIRYHLGRAMAHLKTRAEMKVLEGQPQDEVVVWIRNIDLWNEDIRTAINGLLEDGYIDLEVDGEVQRYYKPSWVKFVAEMPRDTGSSFSSAFFSRWIRVGVPADSWHAPKDRPSDLEQVLRDRYGLGAKEAMLLNRVAIELADYDQGLNNKTWQAQRSYRITNELYFAVAESTMARRQRDEQWRAMLVDFEKASFDPRIDVPQTKSQHQLALRYDKLSRETLLKECVRLLACRFESERNDLGFSDKDIVRNILQISFGVDSLPTLTVDYPWSEPAAGFSDRVVMTPPIIETLSVLGGAEAVGRGVILEGKSGTVKTTAAIRYAEMTGRKPYKYQSHAGSLVSDLTQEVIRDLKGEFSIKEKELYKRLAEGNAVIIIDEADVSPHILYVLESVLRGEEWLPSAMPGMPPLHIGKNVFVVFTKNFANYGGRLEIPQRIDARMVTARVRVLMPEEKKMVIESFFGIDVDLTKGASSVTVNDAFPVDVSRLAHEKDVNVPRRMVMDTDIQKGREAIDWDAPLPSLDEIKKMPKVEGMYRPELYPHTRQQAYDGYDSTTGEFFVRQSSLSLVEPIVESRVLGVDHDSFTGKLGVVLNGATHLFPSAGAGMKLLAVKALDPVSGKEISDVTITLLKDGADNYYLQENYRGAPREALIVCRVAVPAQYFGKPIHRGIPLSFSKNVSPQIEEAMTIMGFGSPEQWAGAPQDYREVMHKMVAFFRNFKIEEMADMNDPTGAYLRIMRAQSGVCRQRASAMVRTLLGLGVNARLVVSDVHAYVEVFVPGMGRDRDGWMRLDLGGGGDPMGQNLAPLANERHSSRYVDDLPRPENYEKNAKEYGDRQRQAMERQGVSPQVNPRTPSRGGKSGGNGEKGSSAHASPETFDRQAEASRLEHAIEEFNARIKEVQEISSDVAGDVHAGVDAEFVFARMIDAIRSGIRIDTVFKKSGFRVDPVRLFARYLTPFIKRVKTSRMKNTLESVLFDFSGSMKDYRNPMAFAVGLISGNFWKVRQSAEQFFNYDISWFADEGAVTVFKLGDTIAESSIGDRVAAMMSEGTFGTGGTNIRLALDQKLNELLRSSKFREATTRTVIVFTDGGNVGEDVISTGDGVWEMSPGMKEVANKYVSAGVDIVMIGMGPSAALEVTAFKGARLHYVCIEDNNVTKMALAVARIAELVNTAGDTTLPPGDITKTVFDAGQVTTLATPGGIDMTAVDRPLDIVSDGPNAADPRWLAPTDATDTFIGFTPDITLQGPLT
ncbi:MAG: AAA family ATPase, partial [Candidatus Omnitrophica bacterium]|nr:AAA family ATPase [Candidatus Omnitrophota bacterium]